jgi:hypothetical protein
LLLWAVGGVSCLHSGSDFPVNNLRRHLAKLSQRMNSSKKRATSLIKLPHEEMIFHHMKGSGKSLYRRGIPLRPKKCWGKKVMLTPINITANWREKRILLYITPVIRTHQRANPVIIPKTAPIERT